MKKKELQNLLSNHDQSYQSLQQSLNIYTKNGQPRDKFNRQPNRNIPTDAGAASSNPQSNGQNEHLTPLKGSKEGGGIRGQHGHHHLLAASSNIPGGSNNSVYQGKL